MLIAAAMLLVIQEQRTETWPGGATKAEYEVAYDEAGDEIKNGAYRSYFEEGQLEWEGAFLNGAKDGPWVLYHPNGAKAAAGRFADGLESGPWQTWYASGQRDSKGSYVRGAKSKRWNHWREDGSKDLEASGLYEIEVYRSKKQGRHYRGYIVDNLRQGPWASYWPDGRVQFEGPFVAGQREGRWIFTHPDGVPSSLLCSGEYSGGAWAGRIELPEPPPFDAAAFPAIEPAPGGWPEGREALAAALRDALTKRSLDPGLEARLDVLGTSAIPVALEVLVTLDPEASEDRSAMGFLENGVLRRLCKGHALSPIGSAAPADAPAARELLRAWLSLWALMRTDLVFWEETVPGPSTGTGLRDPLQDPPLLDRDPRYAPEAREASSAASPKTEAAPSALFPARFGKAKRERLRKAPSGTKEAIDRALTWLVAHQDETGRWSNDGFGSGCGKLGKGTCDGPGASAHHVGATGLALLAFLGDGHTPSQGDHEEAVARAFEWLVGQQSEEGLVGERLAHDFLYGHAIATAALCEGYGLGGEGLRKPAERAIQYLQRARNPEGVWRYDMPAVGDNDTSITGWSVNALLAAQGAGLAIDEDAFAYVLHWLDEVSDSKSGRIGYSAPKELSSRTPANEHFPREKGEAMTASGLWMRLRLGQQPKSTEHLARHAKLIASKPPEVDPEGNDHYYWYHGAYALLAMGKPYWKGWEKGLKRSVIDTQLRNGDAKGSWDPTSPWGYAMGRVCTTALLALTLECYYRYPL